MHDEYKETSTMHGEHWEMSAICDGKGQIGDNNQREIPAASEEMSILGEELHLRLKEYAHSYSLKRIEQRRCAMPEEEIREMKKESTNEHT